MKEGRVEFPIRVRVRDYHDFDPLARFLQRLLRVVVGYTEIEDEQPYVAIFHIGDYDPEDVDGRTLPEIVFD